MSLITILKSLESYFWKVIKSKRGFENIESFNVKTFIVKIVNTLLNYYIIYYSYYFVNKCTLSKYALILALFDS